MAELALEGPTHRNRRQKRNVQPVALDLFSPIKVVSWASAHGSCPMRYTINGGDEMVIIFGSGTNEFEFAFDVDALRALVQLGTEALTEMDSRAEATSSEQS
ncbi:hypothetical protein [Actinophytocola glycyrrhizae]|uniref:hypothetical protein n=1 Tax=Actinophytocola glycyrrhizae TaxID=2044873 RepID=UPI00366D6BF0